MPPSSRNPQQLGKKFEQDVQTCLDQIKRSSNGRLDYLRLYDTHSAGAYLPAQPADFVVAASGKGFLLECKSSANHDSLRSCLAANVEPEQAAKHRIWLRTGNEGHFLFRSFTGERIELWHSSMVEYHRRAGKPLPKNGPLRVFEPDTLFQQLVDIYLGD